MKINIVSIIKSIRLSILSVVLANCIFLFSSIVFAQTQSSSNAQTSPSSINLANDPRVEWLKKNAIKIRSVNPMDEDFSDLMPLKKAIGDAQVVMLAEGTHFDGTTFLAKTRLIKFLHQEMGFDVLAFEAGFYDVTRGWQDILAGVNAEKAMNGVRYAWHQRKNELIPLTDYIQAQAKAKRPLEITGFDDQLTGTQTRDYLVSDLKQFFKELGVQTNALDEGSSFSTQLVAMGVLGGYKSPDQSFIDTLADLRKQVAARVANKKQSPSIAFGVQLLESIEGSARQWFISPIDPNPSLTKEQRDKAWLESFGIRDEQMARNLIWQANVRYPKRKIIVTAHSAHTIYSPIWTTDPILKDDEKVKRTGFWVHEALGKKAYSIGFTAYEGKFGRVTDDPKMLRTIVPNQRSTIELEELFHATEMEYAFVNQRNPSRGGKWLWDPIAARPGGGHTTIEGKWNTAFDGIFYMREMRPVTLSEAK